MTINFRVVMGDDKAEKNWERRERYRSAACEERDLDYSI